MKTHSNFNFYMVLGLLIFSSLIFIPSVICGQSSYDMPQQADPSEKYLFFLHNYYVETKGPDGDCHYEDILKAFSDKGFSVISEIRTGKIIPCTYAEKTANQVKTLLKSGVPPENITVSGHSKGGAIVLCVASQLSNPEINFVVMAGCEIAGIKKYDLYPDFSKVKGRVLSIYASSDKVAGSCKDAFSKASDGLIKTEIEIGSNAGHRLFFTPDDIWLSPIIKWSRQEK